jgi:hypothetical protein
MQQTWTNGMRNWIGERKRLVCGERPELVDLDTIGWGKGRTALVLLGSQHETYDQLGIWTTPQNREYDFLDKKSFGRRLRVQVTGIGIFAWQCVALIRHSHCTLERGTQLYGRKRISQAVASKGHLSRHHLCDPGSLRWQQDTRRGNLNVIAGKEWKWKQQERARIKEWISFKKLMMMMMMMLKV